VLALCGERAPAVRVAQREREQENLPMKAWGRHVVAGLAIVAGVGAVASACAHDDSTIFIYNKIAQPSISPGGTCVYSPNPSQTFSNAGTLDVSLGGAYVAEFLIGNQMVAQVDPTVPRTETSIVNIQGAVVRITDSSGVQLATYTDPTAGSVPAAAGGTPGYIAMSVVIVNAATVQNELAALSGGSDVHLITYTKMFGKTLGGQYVESNEFEFPVSLCVGCLISFAVSDISPTCPVLNCIGGGAGSATATEPCSPGQDIPTDCSLCRGNNPLCNPNFLRCNPDAGLLGD
jgi:hypothetical protein